MHIELYEKRMSGRDREEKVGEVRFNPYSYTYHGWTEFVAECLAWKPEFEKIISVPDEIGSPEYGPVTDEKSLLIRTGQLLDRYLYDWELITEDDEQPD